MSLSNLNYKFNDDKQSVTPNLYQARAALGLSLYDKTRVEIEGSFYTKGNKNVSFGDIENVGVSRFVAGAIFPVGLMLITFIGGELFTGNCLTAMGAYDKRFSWGKVARDLCIVWLSNLVGALIIVFLTYYSGNLDYSAGLLGAYSIKVALGKSTITFAKGVTSGILCNILVCAAILLAAAAKDINGKIWAIFFPIMAFVVGGFEHCVANMFYIPMGILAATNDAYVTKAMDAYGITADQIAQLSLKGFFTNQIPVTLGNILGGMIFLGLPCFVVHCKNK